jgi:transglutaminase-like putative cysteine protease
MGRMLKFCYRMELAFSDKVRRHQFTLRMLPQMDERQQITECRVHIRPECDVSEDMDAYGNKYVYGVIEAKHADFQVEISGTAQVDLSRPKKAFGEEQIYRYPSKYTKPGEMITDYYNRHKKDDTDSDADYAKQLMHAIYRDMKYQKGVTSIETTAEQALCSGEGVCQDYAHIMIALLRMAGVPARYAVGMMKGEGFSHAWVEAAVDGSWVGYDPTNDNLVDDTYICISHGRDYQDCIVNRGFFNGSGCVTQQQKINVVVSEV